VKGAESKMISKNTRGIAERLFTDIEVCSKRETAIAIIVAELENFGREAAVEMRERVARFVALTTAMGIRDLRIDIEEEEQREEEWEAGDG
jgi:hypothetical protein